MVQEALHNALKYSEARTITTDLKGSGDELVLRIADDGIGFDVDAPSSNGLGLTSIRERIDAVAGTALIRSARGCGTTIDIRVPLQGAPADAVAV